MGRDRFMERQARLAEDPEVAAWKRCVADRDETIKDLQEQLEVERDFSQSFKGIKSSNLRLFKELLNAREEVRLLQEEIDTLREGYTGP